MDLISALRTGLSSTPSPDRPAGIEVRQDLVSPLGLPVQPPSYEGRLEVHERHLDGEVRPVIELDSAGSSANRIEEGLISAYRAGMYPLPVSSTTVDSGDGLIELTSLETPHRIFDAWFRYSEAPGSDGKSFEDSDLCNELSLAHQRALDPLLEVSAHDLLFGVWDSHRKGPHGQVRVARSFTSTLIGLDPIPQKRFAARRDPLNLGEAGDLPKGAKKLSEQGLSSIPPQAPPQDAVAISSARFLGYLSFPGLRRLGFQRYDETDVRVLLATLCLYGLVLRSDAGWDLRANCSLEPISDLEFTLVGPRQARESFALGLADAEQLFRDAAARVAINDRSVKLAAGTRLNDLVKTAVEKRA
jgi:CRISPR-associated protein Csb1